MLKEDERLELIGRRGLGESIRALSRSTGRSRNTVRKYLRSETSIARRKVAAKRAEKLDPFKDYILARLEDPAPEKATAAMLYREVKELGYSGGLTRVKEFVRQAARPPEPFAIMQGTPAAQAISPASAP